MEITIGDLSNSWRLYFSLIILLYRDEMGQRTYLPAESTITLRCVHLLYNAVHSNSIPDSGTSIV